MPGELALLHALQALHTDVLDALMVGLSTIGRGGAMWIVLGVALLVPRRTRRAGVAVLVALAVSELVVDDVLKPLIARPRPCQVDGSLATPVPCPGDWSFPSGHTTKAFAAATALVVSLPRGARRFAAPVVALAALMGFSRLYLGVHYPTDVLAGAVLGAVLGALAALVVRALARRLTRQKLS